MDPIIISFVPNALGRVIFNADIQTGDGLSHKPITFKLDSGSDFTTLSCMALEILGYTEEYLKSCPYHENEPSTAFYETKPRFQYIVNRSIKFGDRELQGCTIYFALNTKLRSLFGSDILKYFNREIDYDIGKLILKQKKTPVLLMEREVSIQIYSLEN